MNVNCLTGILDIRLVNLKITPSFVIELKFLFLRIPSDIGKFFSGLKFCRIINHF